MSRPRWCPILGALLVLTSSGVGTGSVSHPGARSDPWTPLPGARLAAQEPPARRADSDDPTVGEPAEAEAISEIVLESGSAGGAIRLVQIGNPPRRPVLPDLSREGRTDLPGRVSLEVPSPGLRWEGNWLPPGIYRLVLHTDGFEVTLGAQSLSPSPEIRLPVEIGTMSAPSPRFRATLATRTVGQVQTGHFSLRWGVMILEATLTSPELETVSHERWSLSLVPDLERHEDEMFLGILTGTEDGSGALEARWIRTPAGEQRLRLERPRRRRIFGLRREFLARASRLRTIAENQVATGDAEGGAATAQSAQSYEAEAAQLEPQLAALEGTSREVVGVALPPVAGSRPQFRLETRGGHVYLVIGAAAGGAEFRLP